MIATDHKMFRELKLGGVKALMNAKPAIIDGRRVVNPSEANRQKFMYFGIGYGTK